MCKEFNLGEYKIEFDNEFINYNNLRKKYMDLSVAGYDEFINQYKTNCHNIDEVHNKALDGGYQCISKYIDEAISILISNDLMSIDKNTFIENYYSNFITWDEYFEEVDIKYRNIILNEEQNRAYREDRKNTRGAWQGGGFGIGGAISGAMKAGAMNMATGAAHSIANSVGNSITSANTNAEKEKLFQDESILKNLSFGVMENIFAIHFGIVDALIKNGNSTIKSYPSGESEEKAKALLNNLKTGLISKDKEKGIVNDIVHNDPYNKEIYIFLINKYGDRDLGIEEITEFVDIDISADKNNIIEKYYNNLSRETEEITIESVKKFKTFADNMNISDIQKYLNEFDEILKQHDINIRTVDGILFEEREEASLARKEYNEITAIVSKVTTSTENVIKCAIDEIESHGYKTIIKDKYLSDLNERLIKAIRLQDQVFLNDNYIVDTVVTEKDSDKIIEELKGITLRNMDLLEQRIEEFQEKRNLIIEEADRVFVEEYFKNVVIINEEDIRKEINNIRELDIRSDKVKEEKINFITNKAEKIIKKHNGLLELAIKYEIRINTVKEDNKVEKKGLLGFMSKVIEKGSNLIDSIQEKREKEAWDFITNNETRSLDTFKTRCCNLNE